MCVSLRNRVFLRCIVCVSALLPIVPTSWRLASLCRAYFPLCVAKHRLAVRAAQLIECSHSSPHPPLSIAATAVRRSPPVPSLAPAPGEDPTTPAPQAPDVGIPDDLMECLRVSSSGPPPAEATLSQRPEMDLTRWVAFTPNNSFTIGLMADVRDRLGGSSHLRVKGALS